MSDLYRHMAALVERRQPFVLATVVDTGGSTPALVGAQVVVEPEAFRGTVGGGAFEWRVLADARALLADPGRRTGAIDVHLVRDLAMCCGGQMRVFMQKVEPQPRLWVFGAGHVGTALAEAAARLAFEVTVVDARAEWVRAERFSEVVRAVDAEPEDHLASNPPSSGDYAVVLTHSHALDETIIRRLEPHELAYLGLIGSRGKWARIRRRLEERGVAETALDRVRCPVGLDIGARTPEEIAISIVAEMIARRRGVTTN